jgi:RNA polymerase sigma-70 factor (ECF subfamily)
VGAIQDLSQSVPGAANSHRAGDTDSEFEAIFLEHYKRVFGVLVRLLGDHMRAEELANEVFWKLSRRSPEWLLSSNIGAWLYRTATRAGIDALRSAAHRERYERASASENREMSYTAGPLHDVLRDEEAMRVRAVLESMKPTQAQLLLMRASGASYKELSEALEVAIGGVGTLLNRAETEFRKRYLKLTEGKEKV